MYIFLKCFLFFAESEFLTVHHHETVNFATVHYRCNKQPFFNYPKKICISSSSLLQLSIAVHAPISNDWLIFYIAECLVKLHDYWASDMAFSLTLLSQFLEDMEAYAEVRRKKQLVSWKVSIMQFFIWSFLIEFCFWNSKWWMRLMVIILL